MRLLFPSLDQYNRAHAALSAAGLVRRKRDPGGGLGGLGVGYAGLSPQGTVWIDVDRRDEAVAALAHVDLELLEPALPIVDRAEPICPECAEPLPADGPAECDRCGCCFEWVDIGVVRGPYTGIM